ncbi:MAG TPA: hypothetical protein VGM30_04765 [Puia sp.]|jgi:hypothetical protein
MDEPFLIAVDYKGKQLEFEARLQVLGYTHRFWVGVDAVEVVFERDEEGNYRAIIPPETKGKIPDSGLLQAIAGAIEKILA